MKWKAEAESSRQMCKGPAVLLGTRHRRKHEKARKWKDGLSEEKAWDGIVLGKVSRPC